MISQEKGHTGLPWQVKSDYEPYMIIGAIDGATDAKSRYTEICKMIDPYDDWRELSSNIDYIIKACNSHYELLAAVREARRMAAGDMDIAIDQQADIVAGILKIFIDQMDAAIAKAEGK